jgi:hypothetical protein
VKEHGLEVDFSEAVKILNGMASSIFLRLPSLVVAVIVVEGWPPPGKEIVFQGILQRL